MIIEPQPEYELIDSGDEMKLERYGKVVVARPDPQAIWKKRCIQAEWDKADATFKKAPAPGSAAEKFADNDGEDRGKWHVADSAKGKLEYTDDKTLGACISLGSIKLYARLTPFKHTAIFPEQLANWSWSEDLIKKCIEVTKAKNALKGNGVMADETNQRPKVLNLFGYTGGASVVAAKAGADVTHVDASRGAITWAKENMLATGLPENAIRWMLEDAVNFVKKEIRRGNKYDAIIMDPPVFGRGAKGEVWKIERDLVPLLELCYELLTSEPLFFILNGYASGYSSVAYANNLGILAQKFGGEIENGELLIQERVQGDLPQRLLPCGIVARWKRAI